MENLETSQTVLLLSATVFLPWTDNSNKPSIKKNRKSKDYLLDNLMLGVNIFFCLTAASRLVAFVLFGGPFFCFSYLSLRSLKYQIQLEEDANRHFL